MVGVIKMITCPNCDYNFIPESKDKFFTDEEEPKIYINCPNCKEKIIPTSTKHVSKTTKKTKRAM